ncbi:hypothetical protein SISNIDRAFT_448835 [Sistotremastrum niveocremeum HHB9708]|uniref:Uncharacterized protein n=2 Tax=Sistotremastraceae TaxID=3402574 RepID=A0A165A735_9AGAM|nr:hypothetical protein SISNIDRAFT_448835 [Sistotremastrum niveocremeum HHB9708]KZT43502.1 hypothetical protein SISSUDRAFT_1039929 [Sistotremastrum suecicum HHB10207 ss-3]
MAATGFAAGLSGYSSLPFKWRRKAAYRLGPTLEGTSQPSTGEGAGPSTAQQVKTPSQSDGTPTHVPHETAKNSANDDPPMKEVKPVAVKAEPMNNTSSLLVKTELLDSDFDLLHPRDEIIASSNAPAPQSSPIKPPNIRIQTNEISLPNTTLSSPLSRLTFSTPMPTTRTTSPIPFDDSKISDVTPLLRKSPSPMVTSTASPSHPNAMRSSPPRHTNKTPKLSLPTPSPPPPRSPQIKKSEPPPLDSLSDSDMDISDGDWDEKVTSVVKHETTSKVVTTVWHKPSTGTKPVVSSEVVHSRIVVSKESFTRTSDRHMSNQPSSHTRTTSTTSTTKTPKAAKPIIPERSPSPQRSLPTPPPSSSDILSTQFIAPRAAVNDDPARPIIGVKRKAPAGKRNELGSASTRLESAETAKDSVRPTKPRATIARRSTSPLTPPPPEESSVALLKKEEEEEASLEEILRLLGPRRSQRVRKPRIKREIEEFNLATPKVTRPRRKKVQPGEVPEVREQRKKRSGPQNLDAEVASRKPSRKRVAVKKEVAEGASLKEPENDGSPKGNRVFIRITAEQIRRLPPGVSDDV